MLFSALKNKNTLPYLYIYVSLGCLLIIKINVTTINKVDVFSVNTGFYMDQ